MALRVVAGTARGRRLSAPAGRITRPTSDRAREAVFNSLYSMGAVEAAAVLDLYAGTGALGIEALSRGASRAVFVERDPAAVRALHRNLAATGFTDRAEVIRADALRAVDELNRRKRHFDLALVDPPYAFDSWPELVSRVPAARFVVESDRVVDLGPQLIVHYHKRLGGTVMTYATAAQGGPHPSGAC